MLKGNSTASVSGRVSNFQAQAKGLVLEDATLDAKVQAAPLTAILPLLRRGHRRQIVPARRPRGLPEFALRPMRLGAHHVHRLSVEVLPRPGGRRHRRSGAVAADAVARPARPPLDSSAQTPDVAPILQQKLVTSSPNHPRPGASRPSAPSLAASPDRPRVVGCRYPSSRPSSLPMPSTLPAGGGVVNALTSPSAWGPRADRAFASSASHRGSRRSV